jgi:hypothetical protein
MSEIRCVGGLGRSAFLFGHLGVATVLAVVGCSGGNLGDNPSGGSGGARADSGGRSNRGGTNPTGGEVAGGAAGAGVAETGGTPAVVAYPLLPTTPVSADCSCGDDNYVCNAANQCVPRCDSNGACAVWRVERAVTGLLTSEDTVYFVLEAEHDLFGNPALGEAGQESLWKAVDPDVAPIKVAVLSGERNTLVAHVGEKTYLRARNNVLSAVDDSGSVDTFDAPQELVDISVSRDGVFGVRDDGSIAKLGLEADGSFGAEFVNVVAAGTPQDFPHISLVLAAERLWRSYAESLCSYDLADFEAPPRCMRVEVRALLGATDSRAVVYHDVTDRVHEIDVDKNSSRTLSDYFSQFRGGVLRDGFVTTLFTDVDTRTSQIGRFPTQQTDKPTFLISDAVAFGMSHSDEGGWNDLVLPAVTSDAVYWAQALMGDGRGSGISRYIFRAPLPR